MLVGTIYIGSGKLCNTTNFQAILKNVAGYGMVEPVGHVDFYPNGGNGQPGCSMLDVPAGVDTMVDPEHAFDAFGRHMVACSHMRAVELYIESLDHARSPGDTCPMVGYECTSYEKFTKVWK